MKAKGFFLLFLLPLLMGADLKVPPSVGGDPGDFITINATTDGKVVKWISLDKGLKLFPAELLKDTKTAIVIGTVPGSYRILAYTSDASGPTDPAICVVLINGPPVPPPGPGPNPPPPIPPGPIPGNPFPADGYRAMIIYESADLGKLPKDQVLTLTSGELRTYLNSRAAVVGTTKEYRIVDQNVDFTNESKIWQAALAVKRDSVPWILIGNAKGEFFSGPLPANINDTLTLLKKY